MLGYLSADIICPEKRTVFRERSSRKTVSFEEQIMSKGKYPSIFSQRNWGYCVYYSSVLKIGEYPRIFPSFSWGIFAHVTRLDQSRASENIWWIINFGILLKLHKITWQWQTFMCACCLMASWFFKERKKMKQYTMILKSELRFLRQSPYQLSISSF